MDSYGLLWLGTEDGGLCLYQYETDNFVRYRNAAGMEGTLSQDSVREIFEDRNRDIWVGTYPMGINFYDRSTSAVAVYANNAKDPASLLYDAVEAAREDAAGNLWVATDRGVDYLDRTTDKFTHYIHTNDAQSAMGAGEVNAILVDSDGDVWAGAWGSGVSKFNPNSHKFEQIPFAADKSKITPAVSTSLPAASVWALYEDSHKTIWIGTHEGGLSAYNKNTKIFKNFAFDPNNSKTIASMLVWSIREDSQGNLWVGTVAGLDRMNPLTGEVEQHFTADEKNPGTISGGSVNAIFEDHQHRLWVGTDRGLSLYHPDTQTFTVFTQHNGLSDNGVRGITEDANGTLWLTTNNGFTLLNFDRHTTKAVKRYNGKMIGGFNNGSAFVGRKGDIVLSGRNGLRIYNLAEMSENQVPPALAFTDLKVFTESVQVGAPDHLLSKVINETQQITLNHTQTMFSLSFSALNFRESATNQYAYKLEGFDENWRQVGAQRTALFTNLDAGEYVFKFKAANNDGVWNEVPRSIRIRQLPPLWQTWWAYTLYVMAGIIVLMQFVQSQRAKRRFVEEHNRLLEIKVTERTLALQGKNDDIQAVLSNMQQGLLTIEADGTIHPEYSIFLERIFDTRDIAGRNAVDLLFSAARLGANAITEVKDGLESMLGADELAYDLNSHLLLQEFEIDLGGKPKNLSLDWSPIFVGDAVTKIMVSVRDITKLKAAEEDAELQKHELAIITQVIKVPSATFVSFERSASEFLLENQRIIDAAQCTDAELSADEIALLFRNMHTIKGSCRAYGFTFISDAAHNAESTYALLQSGEYRPSLQLLLEELQVVRVALESYLHVYYVVLERGAEAQGSAAHASGLQAGALKKLRTLLDAVQQKFPEILTPEELQPINNLLNSVDTTPLGETLKPVVSALPSIATELNKPSPAVVIGGCAVNICNSAQQLIINVFSHLLRNSLDHGIENAELRLARDKPSAGTITITAAPRGEAIELALKDDGQGINLDVLFRKGIAMGRWQAEDSPAPSDIANLIFESGVSTKQQVTSISGRGVGMDAVKQFLLAQGATIELNLLGPNPQVSTHHYFEMLIVLPPTIALAAEA